MFQTIEKLILCWKLKNPWTNVYGLARSIIAFSSMVTLILNRPELLFKPSSASIKFPICETGFSAFCFAQNNYFYLNIIRWIFIFLLILVVSGWRPRFTGVLHWYVTYSMQASMVVIDGGEQAASVIAFLLIPITLTDNRKWHWDASENHFSPGIYSKIIAYISFFFIRLQVAIIYFHSTIAKLKNKEWIDGTAVYYYSREKTVGFNSFFDYITHSIIASPLVVIPTWGTLLVQIVIFCSLFAPKKYWRTIFIIAISMHEIFALMLGLISFSMIMTGVLILYLIPIDSVFCKLLAKNKTKKTKKLEEAVS
ncbi:sporulation-delaying protein SdpB family protein [Bacillus sp. JJ1764]|uniref:sporulation-delaying protein SdpB family protein n=1 Tax=Bacillus sp. JJ1764 TaxID=3122964 RepID=UPI002FFFBDC9